MYGVKWLSEKQGLQSRLDRIFISDSHIIILPTYYIIVSREYSLIIAQYYLLLIIITNYCLLIQ